MNCCSLSSLSKYSRKRTNNPLDAFASPSYEEESARDSEESISSSDDIDDYDTNNCCSLSSLAKYNRRKTYNQLDAFAIPSYEEESDSVMSSSDDDDNYDDDCRSISSTPSRPAIDIYFDTFEGNEAELVTIPDYDCVSEIIKKQLISNRYAKISNSQKITAEKDANYFISAFVSDANCTFCDDILPLLCSYYPLFYWSDDYISLQSSGSTHMFIMPKACCKLSDFFHPFINTKIVSDSALILQNTDNKVLELLVRSTISIRENCARNEKLQNLCSWIKT